MEPIDTFKREWPEVKKARSSVLSLVVVTLVIGLGVYTYLNNAVLSGKDATIETLKAQEEGFKNERDDLAKKLASMSGKDPTTESLNALIATSQRVPPSVNERTAAFNLGSNSTFSSEGSLYTGMAILQSGDNSTASSKEDEVRLVKPPLPLSTGRLAKLSTPNLCSDMLISILELDSMKAGMALSQQEQYEFFNTVLSSRLRELLAEVKDRLQRPPRKPIDLPKEYSFGEDIVRDGMLVGFRPYETVHNYLVAYSNSLCDGIPRIKS